MSNWPTKNLEDIVEFQNGLWTGKKAPFVTAPILRNTNFKNGNGSLNYDDVAEIEVEKRQLEKRTLIKGDILLERSGGGPTQPVGRVVYFEGENDRFGFSNFTTRIRVKGGDVDSKYLWFFLHSFYKSGKTELMQKKTTGIRNLTFSEYKQIEIPLPPLEVQKEIVAKLENLLAKISEAKKLRAEAQESADNLLSAELHKIFEEGKKKGWEEKELGSIARVVTGSTPKTSDKEYYGEEYLWARPGDLNEGPVVSTEKKLSEKGFNKGGVRSIPAGSVMMCCIGSIGKLGITSEQMVTNQQINSFVPNQEKVNEKFLFYSLTYIREKFIEGASSTTLKIINKSRCEKIQTLLPPLPAQKKIVARLDSISQKIEAVKKLQNTTEDEFGALENSVLSKAFGGELI